MRIWDVSPGYLNRQSLLGEHNELHAILSVIKHNKSGYARHPETMRWRGYGWALAKRHELLRAEMSLRGYRERSPVASRAKAREWPPAFIDAPKEQLLILSEKYRHLECGRIPLPVNAQQAWAQHKYSVMARDFSEYKQLGRWVASRKNGGNIGDIYPELVSLLRQPPDTGNLRNALQHMWGYVSRYAAPDGRTIERRSTQSLLGAIRHLALLHNVFYLKQSTALSELQAWIRDQSLRYQLNPESIMDCWI